MLLGAFSHQSLQLSQFGQNLVNVAERQNAAMGG
jgi:hypothetical protein